MKRLAGAILITTLLILAACSSNNDEKGDEEARSLYTGTCRLAKIYTDSIRRAPDSTKAIALMERFDERLTELNFNHAPDTDLRLSEGENDTLALLLRRLRASYEARLDSLAHKKAADHPENSTPDFPAVSLPGGEGRGGV